MRVHLSIADAKPIPWRQQKCKALEAEIATFNRRREANPLATADASLTSRSGRNSWFASQDDSVFLERRLSASMSKYSRYYRRLQELLKPYEYFVLLHEASCLDILPQDAS